MDATIAGTHALTRWERIKGGLSPAEWGTVAGMAAVVVGLHVVGFVLLFAVVAPHHFDLGAPGSSASGSASPPTRWACATPSTPTTSARSTTRPAS